MALTTGSPQTATILVTDLVGSTELRVNLGEERAELLRRLHDRLIAAEIASHNGTVVKGLGDGVLAIFAGAADAVSAAVAIQQSLALQNRRSREHPVSLRVGISAGDITLEDGDCFGTPVIEASRLCAAADGGQVLVADLIRLLARGRGDHEFAAFGDLDLKGLPEPVPTAEVLWDARVASSVPLPAPLSIGEWYPFAGRAAEIHGVTSRWKDAAAGGLRLVAISGEPGMGKTRIATELARSVHADGATVLYGRCDEELDTPYRPFVEALRHLVAHASDAVLAAHVAAAGSALSSIVPDLCRRVECEATSADGDRTRLFHAVVDLLARACQDAPVLLVLDDLHWADKSSLLLLRHIVGEGGDLSLLVVGTYRDTDLARTHPLAAALADLRRNPIVERVSLEGLAVEEVAAFLSAAAGTGEVDEPGLVRLAEVLFAETEGNPFFLSEVLSHLMESGAIYQENGRWVGNRELIARLGVPEGVREVLGRRLSALSPAANEALTVGAVIGQEFAVPVLADVLGVSADELVDHLDEAVERRLIDEAPQSFDTFRFSHALVRQTLCEELTTSRRVRLHRKVALTLEEHGGTVGQLAHHYGEAAVMGEEEKALHYARAAGDEAMERFAFEQAVGWYRRALDFDETLDADDVRRCELLLAIGCAMNASGEPADGRPLFAEASDLARATARSDLAAKAAVGYGGDAGVWIDSTDRRGIALVEAALAMDQQVADHVALLERKASWLILTPGSLPERSRIIAEAVELASTSGDLALRGRALVSQLDALRVLDPSRQLLVGDELADIAEELGDRQLFVEAQLARASGFLAANRLDEVETVAVAVGDVGRAERSELSLWFEAAVLCNVAVMRGEFERAEALLASEREHSAPFGEGAVVVAASHEVYIGEKLGDAGRVIAAYEAAMSTPMMADQWFDLPLAIWRGDLHTAAANVRSWWRKWQEGTVLSDFRLTVLAQLARHAGLCGAKEIWSEIYDELLPHGGTWLTSAAVVVADHADLGLGRLAAAMGRRSAAESHFRDAVAAFEASRTRPYLAQACVELASLVADLDDARLLLARADAIADELGLLPVRRRVDEVAAELNVQLV